MRNRSSLLGLLIILLTHLAYGQDTSYKPLATVVVSANKLTEKRIQSPVAISILSPKQIQETKAPRLDYLLNKVSGVYMPTIGNEQHMMSIRQPISLKGLYLYLEDGMPIRTSGLFSSNAFIEIHTDAIYSIEVLKGPASALYGAEAIGGVVNILTNSIPTQKQLTLTSQLNHVGFKKISLHSAIPLAKGGWDITGSWTNQKNGVTEYSDYQKKAASIKHHFTITKKLSGYQTLQYIDYYTQMTGSLDSIKFFQKNFISQQTFTYRQINASRFRQNLQYEWNQNSITTLNAMYRNNTMDQNPTYSIASTSNPTKFKGQVNSNHFDSYVVDVQHRWNLNAIKSKFIVGGYWDVTQQNLVAHYIDIYKDTTLGKYTRFNYPIKDSLITSYHTNISNKALFVNWISDFSPTIHFNMAMRYDDFAYSFTNELTTGTPSANNHFTRFTPKIGITYNKNNIGGYLNYSEGFVPPQITEIYNAIRVPYLLPQQFTNTEIGGWGHFNKLYAEISVYQLKGNNEIISVRQTDGVNLNQNAGGTKHIGVEYQFKYALKPTIEILWNGTYAKHQYVNTQIKGVDVSGNEMNAAPHFFNNLTLHWKPIKNIFTSLEWMHQSKYFMDETNTTAYPGFDVANLRMSYQFKRSEIWLHILNLTNAYYSTMATKNFSVKGTSAYSYYLGDARSISMGWRWDIIK
jgi:outer membrane receptor protein involved in Fe transport